MTQTNLYDFLQRFGLRPCRPGFFFTAQAVRLICDTPRLALFPETALYLKLAAIYHVHADDVAFDISAALRLAWKHNPALLSQLACQHLAVCPLPSTFLLILASPFSLDALSFLRGVLPSDSL